MHNILLFGNIFIFLFRRQAVSYILREYCLEYILHPRHSSNLVTNAHHLYTVTVVILYIQSQRQILSPRENERSVQQSNARAAEAKEKERKQRGERERECEGSEAA